MAERTDRRHTRALPQHLAPGPRAPFDTERPYADHPYSEDNPELAQILSAIAEEVHRQCAALCQGISGQYAARKAVARRTLPKNQVAGAMAALSAECQAALAAARQQAKNELLGRSRMAKALYGKRRRPVQVKRGLMTNPATRGPA
jgi:hypothetical protein